LFRHVNIEAAKTHLPDGTIADSSKACAMYDQIVKGTGGVDLQLLGLGNNGHIGFNEPAEEFKVNTFCADLTERTIEANQRFFASYDDVPKQAYTMGIGTIMSAAKILLVVSGAGKAAIVKEAFFGEVNPKVQASVLRLHHDVTVIGDEAAFSLI
jgi:glucosamine-6-phosphate deaminase